MPVTVVEFVSINEDQPFALAKYLEITEPILKSVGAKIIKRYELDENAVGTNTTETVIVIEYPDRQAVNAVFKSEKYQKALPYREKAFSDYQVQIVS